MNEKEKAREAALKLLDYQDRTSAELRGRLIKKGFDAGIVEEIAASLEESGLVNDERYASLYAQSKLGAGKGSRWIKQKLREKGISEETAENAVGNLIMSGEAENENILCLRRALALCGLSDRFEADADGSIAARSYAGASCAATAAQDSSRIDYFAAKIAPGETDRRVIAKEKEKAKASLTRRLIAAGFPQGAVFDAVRKISEL